MLPQLWSGPGHWGEVGLGRPTSAGDRLVGHKQAPAWLTLPLTVTPPRPVLASNSLCGHEEPGDTPS